MTAATVPDRNHEEWRYAAIERLGEIDLAPRVITVAAGETMREVIRLADPVASQPPEADPWVRRLQVGVEAGGRFELFAVLASADTARLDIEVQLADGAHFEFGGITVGGRDTVRECVTRTIHTEPNATSNQVVRAVHWGRATGNFLGRIDVARNAQKTDAAQDFKGLLLERGASVNAVPQLEIFADDVQCAHGATVGQLDEAARFYMEARGLPPAAARRLLVRGFVGDALVALDDDEAREELMEVALDKVDKHV